MHANFISTGFLALATMAFQASAAPVVSTISNCGTNVSADPDSSDFLQRASFLRTPAIIRANPSLQTKHAGSLCRLTQLAIFIHFYFYQLDLSEIDNRHFDFEELEQRAPQGAWNNFMNAAKSAGHKAKEVITSPRQKLLFWALQSWPPSTG
jgi:hypothetical protein